MKMQMDTSRFKLTRGALPAIGALLLALLACQVQVTDATPTPGGTPGSTCDDAAFVTDVTVPDGTTVKAGQSFTKTWRISNTGTCAWTAGYRLAFFGGEAMGGGSTLLGKSVPPGGQTDISVALTAPSANGTYKGDWRMQNASGRPFGSAVYVQIKVESGGTAVPTSPTGNVTISGTFSVAEVTISFSTANSTPAVAYTASGYSFSVPSGWSGTITPSKGNPGNWSFDPSSWTFTNVTSDQTRDFTGIPTTPTP